VDATYRQELREQNDLNWARIEARLGQVEARMGELEARVEARIGQLEARLDVGLERLRSDLLKWMFLFWTGTALTAIGLTTALRT